MKIIQLVKLSLVELSNFKRKRVAAFRKNLIEMSELEIKHARVSIQIKPTTLFFQVISQFTVSVSSNRWVCFMVLILWNVGGSHLLEYLVHCKPKIFNFLMIYCFWEKHSCCNYPISLKSLQPHFKEPVLIICEHIHHTIICS